MRGFNIEHNNPIYQSRDLKPSAPLVIVHALEINTLDKHILFHELIYSMQQTFYDNIIGIKLEHKPLLCSLDMLKLYTEGNLSEMIRLGTFGPL